MNREEARELAYKCYFCRSTNLGRKKVKFKPVVYGKKYTVELSCTVCKDCNEPHMGQTKQREFVKKLKKKIDAVANAGFA